MKVLICDDEIRVCRLIQHLIDWPALGLEPAGTAHDGNRALEMILEEKPDIVITDIRMPGCSGLEMIARARELRPDLEFIVISGYRHFEYAKSAIQYCVADYLLKPIRKDELNRVLESMCARRRRGEKTAPGPVEQPACSPERDRVRFWQFVDRGGLPPDWLARPAEEEARFCAFKLDGQPGEYLQSAMLTLQERYPSACEFYLEPICSVVCHRVSGSAFELYLSCRTGNGKALRSALRQMAEELRLRLESFPRLQLTLVIGPETEADDLRRGYQAMCRCMMQRIVRPEGAVADSAPPPVPTEEMKAAAAAFQKELKKQATRLDAAELQAAVKRLEQDLQAQNAVSAKVFLEQAAGFCRLFLCTLEENHLEVERADDLYGGYLARLETCGSIREVCGVMSAVFSEEIRRQADYQQRADTRPIRQAKQYIQEHCGEPLTLEDVAGRAGFSPSYFSSMFKKEVGMTFLEYLQETRMELAKRLLRDTDLRVADICEAVGYSDNKSFVKTFSRIAGLKPNAFRKLYHRR